MGGGVTFLDVTPPFFDGVMGCGRYGLQPAWGREKIFIYKTTCCGSFVGDVRKLAHEGYARRETSRVSSSRGEEMGPRAVGALRVAFYMFGV